MSSTLDIQIVSTPNLEKIENFINDSSYRESIEFSANFNTRLCIERRLRLPFFDPQTGVAQNHSSLFMNRRQRMPGFREGQLYSYPTARWRKSRRQYLTKIFRPFGSFSTSTTITSSTLQSSSTIGNNQHQHSSHHHKRFIDASAPSTQSNNTDSLTSGSGGIVSGNISHLPFENENEFNVSYLDNECSLGGGGADTSDSKDSQQNNTIKDDLPKEWFYEDIDINDIDSLEEPKSPVDDEYDYDPRYGNKKRKKRKPGRKSNVLPHHMGGDGLPRKGRPPGGGGNVSNITGSSGGSFGRGRGRRKNQNSRLSSSLGSTNTSRISIAEPPSFETAALAVEQATVRGILDDNNDLRNYRKYL